MSDLSDYKGLGYMLNRDISKKILDLLYDYMSIKSETGTALEREAEKFLINHLSKIPYFKSNHHLYGSYKIKDDPLSRAVTWALVKGTGPDTVILMHHNDVVDVLDYKSLSTYAYSPDELKEQLMKIKNELHQQARADLMSGDYIFGRGSADMKSGGAIQLTLLEEYTQINDLQGNILLISVPDEENTSAGMRGAIELLEELSNDHTLTYKALINSEPHQRKDEAVGIISEGSVGKIMPLIYVRGSLAHVGKIFEGFNPVPLLSRIVVDSDINLDLTDICDGESAPPPTWIYLKDSKKHYDVSMPLSITGYLSILTLQSEPRDIVNRVIRLCEDSFDSHIKVLNEKYIDYKLSLNEQVENLPWQTRVVTFDQLYSEANRDYGDEFIESYNRYYNTIEKKIADSCIDMMAGTNDLIEFTFNYIKDLSPRIVVAIAPPFYPSVSNSSMDLDEDIGNLSTTIDRFALENFGQHYIKENYFTGISDLSYTSIKNYRDVESSIVDNMPLYGRVYSIPLEIIERLSMPGFNIGPWGKDFHKLTERVLKEDVCKRTPSILDYAVGLILGWHHKEDN